MGVLVGGIECLDFMDILIVFIGGKMYVIIEIYEEIIVCMEEEEEVKK